MARKIGVDEPGTKSDPDSARVTNSTVKVIAGCAALAAFGVAVIAGLANHNSASLILTRALIAMVLCYLVGWIIGLICRHVLDDHVKAHQQAIPAPDLLEELSESEKPIPVDSEEEIMTV